MALPTATSGLLEARRWRRAFNRPLTTAHGRWTHREGCYLRWQTDADVRFAEVSPLPDFGTETLEAASQVLGPFLGDCGVTDLIALEQAAGPALRWALSCLRHGLAEAPLTRTVPSAALLGAPDVGVALEAVEAGFRVLKLKIGVSDAAQERRAVADLVQALPHGVTLRLDANGGLAPEAVCPWFQAASAWPVEFIEQPLAPGREADVVALSRESGVALAFDESVAGFGSLQEQSERHPEVILVVKPPLLGDLAAFRDWRKAHPETTLVYSSALESGFGQMVARHLAACDPGKTLAAGLGVEAWFRPDAFGLPLDGPDLALQDLKQRGEHCWSQAASLNFCP